MDNIIRMEALEVLRDAVAKTLERKRSLGQYAVIWQDGQLVYLGGNPVKMGKCVKIPLTMASGKIKRP